MIDLPYPTSLEGRTEEKITAIYMYLYQLKEAIELAIDNVGVNTSGQTLNEQIDTISQLTAAARIAAEDAQQMAQRSGITVEDVLSSAGFAQRLSDLQTLMEGYTDAAASAVEAKIPTKVGQLQNDKGYIKKTVNNLTNYYLKDETYTKTEVGDLLAAVPHFAIEVVEALPTTNISSSTLYMLPLEDHAEGDMYEEWVYLNNTWEKLGSQSVNLTNYYNKSETDNAVSNALSAAKEYADEIKPTKLSDLSNDEGYIKKSTTELSNYYQKSEVERLIPSKVSELTNDENYVGNTTSSLLNYYLKTEIDTKISESLTSANSHADSAAEEVEAKIPTKLSQLTNDKGYMQKSTKSLTYYDQSTVVDSKDAATLSSAKSYADEKDTSTLDAAKAYTDGLSYSLSINYDTGELIYNRTQEE